MNSHRYDSGSQDSKAGGEAMNLSEELATPQLGEAAPTGAASDDLIGIADIRMLFKLGRTAAYELTRRRGFPDHIEISPHCYRWWAGEVHEFAATLRRERAQGRARRAKKSQLPVPASPPCRITGKVRAARTRKEAS